MPSKDSHPDTGSRPLTHQSCSHTSSRIPHPYANMLLERLSDYSRAPTGPSHDSICMQSSKSRWQMATARHLIQCLSQMPSNCLEGEKEEEEEGHLVTQPSSWASWDDDRSQEEKGNWKEKFLQGWSKSPMPEDMPWNKELCIGSYIRVNVGQEICMLLWAVHHPIFTTFSLLSWFLHSGTHFHLMINNRNTFQYRLPQPSSLGTILYSKHYKECTWKLI